MTAALLRHYAKEFAEARRWLRSQPADIRAVYESEIAASAAPKQPARPMSDTEYWEQFGARPQGDKK